MNVRAATEAEYWDSKEQDVWQRCLKRLSVELGSEDYNAWIRPLQASYDNGGLVLYAPNRYVKDEVQRLYADRLQELVGDYDDSGHVRQVAFVVGSRDQPPGQPLRAGPRSPTHQEANGNDSPRGRQDTRRNLDPAFVFSTFMQGKSNELAKAAACQVAANCALRVGDQDAPTYNPLLLYGGVGLGKTHLMHAIGNEVLAKAPATKVAYLPSEQFGNDIVRGIRTHTIQDVTDRYRSLDVLLIDDIQFFADKAGFQEEFFHVFNAVLQRGKQMVLTSDRYPREINGLESRLKSRFVGGLTVEVDLPELETRVAILQNKGEAEGVEIPMDVALYIAKRIRSNVRELKGALQRVVASARFTQSEVTVDLVRRSLHTLFAIQNRKVTVDHIQKVVAEYYKIKQSDMMSKCRGRGVARPRQIAMCLAKAFTAHSLPDIGDRFGGRDHTTVLYACRKVAELREQNPDIAEDYRNLSRLLNQD